MAVPILFEALPTRASATPAEREAHLESLAPLRSLGLAAMNVPEIINGHYQTVDPRGFALDVQERLGVPAILNRITVHHTKEDLAAWARLTRDLGIEHAVLVGGESSAIEYPGIGVEEALPIVAPHMTSTGVITIPTRRSKRFDEPERLLRKARRGASFAVSQILLESASPARLQADVAAAAGDADEAPLHLYWSLAPVRRSQDVAFLRWLGVEVPRDVGRWLDDASGPRARARRSQEINLAIARNLLEDAERFGGPRVGFCVEHVMAGNVEAAVDLVTEVGRLCCEFAAIPA